MHTNRVPISYSEIVSLTRETRENTKKHLNEKESARSEQEKNLTPEKRIRMGIDGASYAPKGKRQEKRERFQSHEGRKGKG